MSDSTTQRGLSSDQAQARLDSYGPNEPIVVRHEALLAGLLHRLASPLVLILLLSSAAAALLGEVSDAAIIFGIVVLSVIIESVQTRRSAVAADALKAKVVQRATVLRDGTFRELPRSEIVPGDVVKLTAGDMVPADADLLEAKDFHVSEAAMTGESLPVEKRARTGKASSPNDIVFMGSSVVSGHALALVTATGAASKFGEIAKALAARAPQTEFERGIARFGAFILRTVLFLTLFVFAVMALRHRPALESLLFALSLAVGLTPEFLPMITTVTLSRGAARMADHKVIVKNLASIQNFGSIDILCSDKTGTLTTGEMQLSLHVDPFGSSAERPLLLCYLNSYFETGVDNPLDAAVLTRANLNPLDAAVLKHEHPDISGYTKVDEIPFDFERRLVSVVAERDGKRLLVTKGAPERIVELSHDLELAGERVTLDAAARERAINTFGELGKQGYRVLGVAIKDLSGTQTFSKDDECELTLAGFIAFSDPPRDDVPQVLTELKDKGIVVKILSGDSELVAAHVCRAVGIPTEGLLLGDDVEKMSDPALSQQAERVHVFARMSPAQKNRVLRALQRRGHVVGFLGDGINDAPSLHAADVGISVSGATDVARDAADVILLEPSLRVLLDGVLEGRRAFGNVMKYLLMGTSSNFGNMFSMAGAAALLPFLPMLPSQILLNGFLYDLAQITIPSDHVDADFVKKPRCWNIDLIRRFMFGMGPVSSLYDFLTFFVLLRFFHAGEALFHTGWFVESLATQTLVIFVVRTFGNPLRSRPSVALSMTVCAIVALGLVLPYSPIAGFLGLVPLPASFLLFVAGATLTYLLLVQGVKGWLMR
ncbi:MAG TPA: magnesium-translocating P-type ATPase [Polyangiaceae bacterium]|jgi:Mg2+-importing ATPase